MFEKLRICRSARGLQHVIRLAKAADKTIGFVPTMGALHRGHASLIRKAANDCDVVITSIYANPTQFDNEDDLVNYPKTEKADIELLQREGGHVAFIPITADLYYQVGVTHINYGTLTATLEGAHRKGHFDGMSTVVRRLLDIVTPDRAYFGEKDWQQLAIVSEMCKREGIKTEIIGCPIIREDDGLALSSRNLRLNADQRKNALAISAGVFGVATLDRSSNLDQLAVDILSNLKSNNLEPDYVKIVDAFSFEEVNEIKPDVAYRILLAAFSGKIRLIDNGPVSSL